MTSKKEPKKGSSFGVIGVLYNYGLSRITPNTAVRRLVNALGSNNEDTSVAAYMALTKMGPRIAPAIVEFAKQGRQTVSLVQLLGDLGDPGVLKDLEEFAHSSDNEVASAAAESLEALKQSNRKAE